eukprot:CAMPEP_0180832110 /NCGR_PEP_ID=MMETSP1038_2-20121128/76671_1 /TAXON_ID=632150 /ORGANISM="Azadinium spinosum, Strain 3D9" /LENGTH=82 /DNA_ID=CAMNT_0022875301 /DNA_START=306 /DNA_END=551 /DNA_ORIENTATION=+
MESISAQAINLITEFVTQGLSNTAWAFAAIEIVDLFEAISAAAIAKISAFVPQELSNTAWACATLEILNLPLLPAISSAALR